MPARGMGALTPRRFHHSEFPAARLAATRDFTASVCVPARNEAANIQATVDQLVRLREAGVLDQVVVLDDSTDGTGDIAEAAGAEVRDQSSLRAEFGRVDGKGDGLWRGLEVCPGEVICFLDADSADFGERFPCGLIGAVGIERMGEVDLEVRQNRHRSLQELGPMAEAVAAGILSRVARDGRLRDAALVPERPPAATLAREAA